MNKKVAILIALLLGCVVVWAAGPVPGTDNYLTITQVSGSPRINVEGANFHVTGTTVFDSAVTLSSGSVISTATASRLAVFDSTSALAANGSITTGALTKSVSSGATLAASGLNDDGTNITASEPMLLTKNVQGNESTFALTSGGAAATFVSIAIPSNSAANIQVEYVLEASTVTPHVQAFGGIVLFNAVNVAGAITCTNSTPTTSALATDSGTLTATFSCADATGGALALKVTDTSSITPTTNRIRYRVRALAATTLVVTPS